MNSSTPIKSVEPVKLAIPKKFEFLFGPARYKAAWGGRGSAKSHSFASALTILGSGQSYFQRPITILCAREIQNSIRDSVKRLLDKKIRENGLSNFFSSTDAEIRGPESWPSLFIFKGLHNSPDSVKSTEGIDIAWVEEANTVSQTSLELLIPTIRNDSSELWFTWNPKLAKDPVDKLFRGPDGAPPGAIVREIQYEDNKFFPQVLRDEMEWDKSRDNEKYLHVWRGQYKTRNEARVFKNWRIEEFPEPPKGTPFLFGADWGFSVDPTVLVRMFIIGTTLYIDYEAYKIGCEIDDIPKLFAGKDSAKNPADWTSFHEDLWPGVPGAKRGTIVADSARPETISYVKRAGFMIEGAKKGKGSIEDGIEFLQNYDIVVHPRCIHTIDELSFYSYKTDPLTNKVIPELVDKKNHVIDSLRYALEGVRSGAALWAKLGRRK